ncbi:hypothetical protein NADFUDRAFT_80889 [Nadsonia fulvescens var. elongata DSM 6958]|uniref:RanBD1 domain-containing protein n=1 Tax=Nadsonia fulvescens var. elongata DSM 6958 TaxID=857566 RepID=A0A1E3PQJ4_9ASCO|nr:hypothetical protein NADFUDRAFT_80889 [Nadsonia fulvescens var. elongata DSM 6958]
MSDPTLNRIADSKDAEKSGSKVTGSNIVETKKRLLDQPTRSDDGSNTANVVEDDQEIPSKRMKNEEVEEIIGDKPIESDLAVKAETKAETRANTVEKDDMPVKEASEEFEPQTVDTASSSKLKHTFGCSSFGSFTTSLNSKKSSDSTEPLTEVSNTVSSNTTASPSSSNFSFGSGLPFGGSAFSILPKKNIFESSNIEKEGGDTEGEDTKLKSKETSDASKALDSNSSATENFSFGSGLSFGSSFGNVISGLSKKDNPWSEAKEEFQEEDVIDNETEDTSKDDLYVQIGKPLEKKVVETGEEDEKSVFTCRSKLYSLDLTATAEGWKERGVGTIHVNTKEVDGVKKSRVVMRSDGLLRVILNAPLLEKFEVMKGMSSSLQSEKFVRITAFENGKPFQYALKTGNKNTANELYDNIQMLIPK